MSKRAAIHRALLAVTPNASAEASGGAAGKLGIYAAVAKANAAGGVIGRPAVEAPGMARADIDREPLQKCIYNNGMTISDDAPMTFEPGDNRGMQTFHLTEILADGGLRPSGR